MTSHILRAVSALLVAALLAHTTGCTAYHPAAIPGDSQQPADEQSIGEVRPGWDVRVILRTGDTLAGRVARVESDALIFDRSGNYGYEEQRVPFAGIESIERKVAAHTAEWTLGIVVVTSMAIIYAFGKGMSGMN